MSYDLCSPLSFVVHVRRVSLFVLSVISVGGGGISEQRNQKGREGAATKVLQIKITFGWKGSGMQQTQKIA